MLTIVLVGLGGAIGSVLRHLISARVQHRSHSGFPWGTFAVNGTGSFLIGVVFAFFDRGFYSNDLLVFLVAGILGGYTTFSTFSLENMKLIENRHFDWLVYNTAGQVAGGSLLAATGFLAGTAVF